MRRPTLRGLIPTFVWLAAPQSNQANVSNLVSEYLNHNITVGAIDIDSGWSTVTTSSLTRKQFPDLVSSTAETINNDDDEEIQYDGHGWPSIILKTNLQRKSHDMLQGSLISELHAKGIYTILWATEW